MGVRTIRPAVLMGVMIVRNVSVLMGERFMLMMMVMAFRQVQPQS